MRTILYSTSAERAAPFEAALRASGYGPCVCVIERGASDADVAASVDCGIVVVDLALGTPLAIEVLRRVGASSRRVPALLSILGEPEDSDVDDLIAAGASIYYPADPVKLSTRLRFLHAALERRVEIGRLIAQLEEAREQAARVERDYRDMLARCPNPISIYRDGAFVWCNQALATLAGYSDPAELIGKSILVLAPPHVEPVVEERMRLRRLDGDLPAIELPMLRRDGTIVETVSVGMPVMFDGAPAYMGYVTDITEQRRLEMQVVASERMAALGRLAASVGHEINNPLTYVMGNLQLAMRTAGLGADVMAKLADALEGADRVRRIVQDLRVFSQREHEELAAVDVRAVIDSCARMAATEAHQRAQLVIDIDGAPIARASTARLGQVVTNLLLNAVQAIPEGRAHQHTVMIRARTAAAVVEIVVEDTGTGIAPEDVPHVFEPFFSTKGERGGTGLGLSICKMLVAQQGGEIAIESEQGRGTRVTVRLPAAEQTRVDAMPETAKPLARRRVLIIDDDPRVAESVGALLSEHDVTIVASARDALATIATAAPFDVILCDLMMPEISGAQLYQRLRADAPGLEQRVVFITGGAFTAATAEFIESVPNTCLHKPFALRELHAAIERVR